MRLKLPAYGKRLLLQRRAGKLPLVVHFIFGDDWRAETVCTFACAGSWHPLLALQPDAYAPGIYDFSVVTGIEVALFDQSASFDDEASEAWDLLGELAFWAAGVMVHSDSFSGVRHGHELALLARCYPDRENAEKNHGWPRWWSAETDKRNGTRQETWFRAVHDSARDGAAASV